MLARQIAKKYSHDSCAIVALNDGGVVVGVARVMVPLPALPGVAIAAPFTCSEPLLMVMPPEKLLPVLERVTTPGWVMALA